ncbi:phage tail tube protein [Anaerotignum sp. MSJ-24]|uniref:phage tail tube protein n=1 Tax=Anaerotignum sp. MSJ-24 TaxID=2841521 RepID=UPI001C101F78|nr:phage tail tube protein [Anaerotignum sp. MSJ-24]MBU5464970.1 phage tail tube protein [Anaerotignum sp. MSJ-24]
MADSIKTNQIIRGTYGRVWIDGELFANVKSFEAKLTLNYEEVDLSNDLGKHQRYMGFTGEGTMTLHKVNSKIFAKVAKAIKSGEMPEISVVGKLEDPTALGAERVSFTEVTIDEVMALKFENATIGEEEVPFKFADYEPLDLIA